MREERQVTREWLVTAPAMVLPLVGSLLYFVLLSDHWTGRAAYTATKVFTGVWPAVAVFGILGRKFPGGRLGEAGRHLKAVPVGLLSGLLIVGLMFGLMAGPMGRVVAAGTANIRAKASALGFLEHYWLFGLFLALVHSLIEEYYWRWFLYGRLRELMRPPAAHALAGAAFAAHHVVVTTQYFGAAWGILLGALVGVGGAIWSVMYERQRSLAGAWVSHAVVDFGLLAIGHELLFGIYF